MKKSHLSVAPDPMLLPPVEPETSVDPMTVYDASLVGSPLDELVALRAVVARAIDAESISGRDLAALSKRLVEISRDIAALRGRLAEEAREAESSGVSSDSEWSEEAI